MTPALPAAGAPSKRKQSATLQQSVAEMLDREAIRQLPVDYCHFIRMRDHAGLAALFCENARFEAAFGDGARASGLQALREFVETTVPRLDPWPFVHNHHVRLIGRERAKGRVWIELRLGSENYRVTHIGTYDDTYVKENGRWKFEERVLEAIPI